MVEGNLNAFVDCNLVDSRAIDLGSRHLSESLQGTETPSGI
jgi:hypothetical protein